MTSVCYFYTQSCNASPIFFELGTPVGHSIGYIRSENGCGKSEKGSGFGGLDGTPPPKIPGNTPRGKKNSTFKSNLIQIELTKKEHFLLFCSYLPQLTQ